VTEQHYEGARHRTENNGGDDQAQVPADEGRQ
jgi:hypothetical protein